jgi:hypothetical protein
LIGLSFLVYSWPCSSNGGAPLPSPTGVRARAALTIWIRFSGFFVPADGTSAAKFKETETSVRRRFVGSSRTKLHQFVYAMHVGTRHNKHNGGLRIYWLMRVGRPIRGRPWHRSHFRHAALSDRLRPQPAPAVICGRLGRAVAGPASRGGVRRCKP